MPVVADYFWEFSLDDGVESGRFSLRVNYGPNPNNKPSGSLAGEPCTTTGTLIQCTSKAAQITVAVDPIADSISATVRKKDLKAESGRVLATTGAILEQQTLFQGIGAYTAVPSGILTPGSTGDLASMDDVYILGTPR